MNVKKRHKYSSKRKPTYPLEEMKRLIQEGKVTDPGINVQQTANELGFSIDEAHEEILTLEKRHFHVSATQPHNHKVWQDAYKKETEIRGAKIRIYIKFKKFRDTFLLTSFKLDES